VNRAPLTREDYDRIRAARDAQVRARIAVDPDTCKGCAGELGNFTRGCKTCWDRLRRRRRREDPVKRARDQLKWREARQRRTARERLAREQEAA
jgi:hypothetical protein